MKQISIIFIITCLVGCFGSTPEKTGQEGKTLPNFNLLLPDSVTWINTSHVPTNKPLVLFYFNPHCPYCRAQTKDIIEDMDKLKNIQFYFITPFSFREMKSYYKEFQLAKYANITMGRDTANFMGDYFEITGVPYMAIYNKDKKLKKAFMGKIYSSQLKKVAEEE
jgi:thiol-disulfide isomerase/thioredoxin